MKRIILSTDNPNKVREVKAILKDLPYQVLAKSESGLEAREVIEDGKTLKDNAKIKVMALDPGEEMVIADDTGLFVTALGGLPGVYTARYAGEGCTEADNRAKLLDALKGEEDRSAYFETVIAIRQKDRVDFVTGTCPGRISDKEEGQEGFGYDPIFIPQGEEVTFASMGDEKKNRISHRALALEGLVHFLQDKEANTR